MVQFKFMALAATTATAKISVQVHRNLEVAKQSNVVVKFHSDEALSIHRRRLKGGASRTETIESLVNSLKEHTTTSQASVKSLLANQVESTAVQVATTWIDCPTDLVQKIASVPEVKSIYEPVVMALSETKSDDKPASSVNDNSKWGSKRSKHRRCGPKVSRGTALSWPTSTPVFAIPMSWFNPYNKTNQLPSDTDGHGTHVMASWWERKVLVSLPRPSGLRAKGARVGGARTVWWCNALNSCFVPTTKTAGNNCDSSKAPHVINGSFGEHRMDFFLEDTIASYPAASPQVIAVGSTNSGDFLALDSSLGPSVRKRGKLDISAPGVSIHSAVHFSDNGFIRDSGTSMAAPHVSGAIALYLSANNGASYDQVYAALTESVDTDTLYPPNKTCGGIPNTKYPNNHFDLFGYGRLNIFNAVTPPPSTTLPPPSPKGSKSTQVLNPTNA
ncbi:hypothetical protein DYB37_010565 [Aphanomyces astaci]|uniref:subtilisin n=1 Tax=Aphanomyces astaci TaxID=112090 RepID=A0A3R6Y0U1_APHAT|nr:hypothetical protein DYB35_008725 [Aphanomyces astaci]RHZ29171.1 hypothetical protein DYB37_010565 [Aphanomyces astaci]